MIHCPVTFWLVVSPPLKNVSQLGVLFPIWKNKCSKPPTSISWVCLKIVYPYTQWFCWSLSLLNGYNWGYTPFSDIPSCMLSHYYPINTWDLPGTADAPRLTGLRRHLPLWELEATPLKCWVRVGCTTGHNLYTYIHIYICIYIYIESYIYIHIHAYIHAYIYILIN